MTYKQLIEKLQTIPANRLDENFNEVSLDTFIEETMACDEAHLYVRTSENKSKVLCKKQPTEEQNY